MMYGMEYSGNVIVNSHLRKNLYDKLLIYENKILMQLI